MVVSGVLVLFCRIFGFRIESFRFSRFQLQGSEACLRDLQH